ncbi:MAG: dipeptidyl-peptidase-4 [Saprospiraceae bacterium]|jgi:dipeptidyl-peptidase-4
MKRFFWLFMVTIIATPMFAQEATTITVEDIYASRKLSAKRISGFNFLNDGKHYTRLEGTKINQYDLTTGEMVATLFDAGEVPENTDFNGQIDSYQFSDDEGQIVIASQTEQIYRRSTRAKYYVYKRKTKSLTPIYNDGKIRYATFSDQGDKVAFIFENNLYFKKISDKKVTQVTFDGKINEIINGGTDWVYEEEFAFSRGFQWSPDGSKIAYYRFDETEVKEFTMTNYRDDAYPEYVTFKYPKVGAKNSKVSIIIYNVTENAVAKVKMAKPMEYIPRIVWSKDSGKLIVFNMNRHQNFLQLLAADTKTGETTVLLEEKNKYYIDIHDNLTFLEDGKQFVWISEKDGWNHVYLYDMKGQQVAQLTSGKWEVTNFYGVDEVNNKFYYQAAKDGPMRRHIYEGNLQRLKQQTADRQMTTEKGTNTAQFSSTFDYYVNTHAAINSPSNYTVYTRGSKAVRVIEDNATLKATQKEMNVLPVEFFEFFTEEKVKLNGYMIKPTNFDANKKYPVFMYQYSGPGSQQVVDSWRGANYWWFQMLAQQGYLIACVDGRGTGARGEEFKKMTYKQLGHYETLDQIEAAKWLGRLPYTDANRIGIFGWSYGGYLSSLAILKGNDVFKAAIAAAPVTNWKWYDSIYTERYMQTSEENPEGYQQNSPVYFADQLKGNYLLVHGMGDDNVHFQNTAEMANALIAANKQFDTYFYPNRNHGIYGGNTRLHLFTKMTNFLTEHLMNDDSPVGGE